MNKIFKNPGLIIAVLLCCIFALFSAKNRTAPGVKPDADNAGLKLPEGFGALVAAAKVGEARHIAITKKGDLYVKLFRMINGKGILMLQDTDADGKFDKTTSFGNYKGTGVYIKDGYLYSSSDTEVFRYKLDADEHVINPDVPEKLVTGLIDRGQHETKSLVLDDKGNIYVNIGAYSNVCQVKDRLAGSPGMAGCPILDSAGGIWQFKADKMNQRIGDGVRYATGLRNVVGLDWNYQTNSLFVMQHGRDGLQDYKDLFDLKTAVQLPAECMFELKKGDNAGWPYAYYDPFQKKKIQCPEYGGDGKKEGSKEFINPAAAYPAHMAPNGLLFYTGNMFPARYKNGAFIAFHGSWNRAPEPQKGYFVVFQPFKDGKPYGDWEIFADGFSGKAEVSSPNQALHRPCGLVQGADGSLYVSDDARTSGGTIYRIVYNKK